ncbi:TIGR02285 family protein [Aestuariibacter salexigens]|uniref:TIGR02285 family protein n=1 Tax=Aestuariibacter salexigens TaxID=226010 RepID=UPI00146FB143|nr:TIGR02285 family protein [Aestuariibacter salexigens]
MMLLRLAVLLTFICVSCRSISADDNIYWQTYHLPPILIKTGELTGQGFVDETLQLIIERLPQYQHHMPLASHARALEDLRLGKQVCHPSLYLTEERKTFAYFSLPSIISPSHRLILKDGKTLPDALNIPVDLTRVIQSPEVIFGLIRGRSYGVILDKLVSKLPNEQRFLLSAEEADAAIKLVALGRLDATIGYPYEVNYFTTHSERESELRQYQIAGVAPYAVGYIACPKNPWGQQVITQINEVLVTLRTSPEYISAMTKWWANERQSAWFQQAVKEQFASPSR